MNPSSLFGLSEHLERLSKDGDPMATLLRSHQPTGSTPVEGCCTSHWKSGALQRRVSKDHFLNSLDAVRKSEQVEQVEQVERGIQTFTDVQPDFFHQLLVHQSKISCKILQTARKELPLSWFVQARQAR